VPCGCDYLQIQSKEPTTCDMEINGCDKC